MKITPGMIEAKIKDEFYFTAYEGFIGSDRTSIKSADIPLLKKLTFCVLVLESGFTVTGESAPIDPENFDAEKGKEIARRKAVDQMWQLMGFAAWEWLHKAK